MLQNVINETGAIHSSVCGIGGAIGVTKILFCQRKPGLDDFADFRGISVEACDLLRRNSNVGRALSLWSGTGRG